MLWPYTTTGQSKAYLRRALWQLRSLLRSEARSGAVPVLVTGAQWIQCNPALDLWLDVEVFDDAYKSTEGIPGRELSSSQATDLKEAVSLYTGDLLENHYQEWCLYERERLRHEFVVMLDKLASYYETHRLYEVAMSYAERNLTCDRAREHTHRQLMRLQYLADDRTMAMRQYECCVDALREELDTAPSEVTNQLYEQIRTGRVCATGNAPPEELRRSDTSFHGTLSRLNAALDLLNEAQDRVREEIAVLEEKFRQPDQVEAG